MREAIRELSGLYEKFRVADPTAGTYRRLGGCHAPREMRILDSRSAEADGEHFRNLICLEHRLLGQCGRFHFATLTGEV